MKKGKGITQDTNTIWQLDAAVARPIAPGLLEPSIVGIGKIHGLAPARLGLGVQKSGRSTGNTRGRVTVVGATVIVGFGQGRIARFTDQIITSGMGESGDSGSLLLDYGNRAVGLLFAGSEKSTLYHPIHAVLDSLSIRLTPDDTFPGEDTDSEFRSLQDHCRNNTADLFKLPNVVGVGIGNKVTAGHDIGMHCLTVLVSRKLPAGMLRDDEMIPQEVGPFPTDVVECGELRADSASWYHRRLDRKAAMRPARPGLSIGHFRVSAGTLGAVCYDLSNGEPLLLSNNHVLANATDGSDGVAAIGDPVLQPGRLDGGREPQDQLATLLRFAPLSFG